ncbi:YihY/virulence factor BrkB family protein [Acidovorax sp. LjRoot129]|uniref:YihY/virulence factor BrkB family protein n=1 Tax=Acidovorax sp. LjRoot129 TaxID=3342260 RepID=UPI003ED0A1DB
MKLQSILAILKKSVNEWIDDYAPSMGAAIAYYTVFSIAPLLIIVIAVAGYVFGEEAVRGSLHSQISGLVGNDGATAIQGLISSAREPTEGVVASGISIGLLIVGATTVFAEIQSALDRIWHVPEKAKPSGLWGLLRARFLSFGLILGLAFLLSASLVVSAAVAAAGSYFSGLMPGWELLLQGLNLALSLCVEAALFAMIFKLMPSVKIAWSDVWIGAAVTAALFEIGKVLIALYVGKAGVSSTYAAAGSIAVLLIWVYYAAQIFLFGAEFTKVYAIERGSHRPASGAAAQGAGEGAQALAPEWQAKLDRVGLPAKEPQPAATSSVDDLPPALQVGVAVVMAGMWLLRARRSAGPGPTPPAARSDGRL